MEEKFFTSQQVAQRLGISKQTLLRYEKRGILPKAVRNPINGWRIYTENNLRKIREIVRGHAEEGTDRFS